jgi:tRNA pseudouridine55 synthase
VEKNNTLLGEEFPFPLLEQDTIADFSTWLETARISGAVAVVDKPLRWTSFDVVNKLRWLTKVKKVGHAGTLDPLATGVLVVCFGKATKWIDRIQSGVKEYSASVKLGATTLTDDAEGEEIPGEYSPEQLTMQDIERAVVQFVGDIRQIPPMYSAIKKDGKPLYKLARKGTIIEREERAVTIHSIDRIEWNTPLVQCSVQCSKGTYIRSLARDIGSTLGCGGYLVGLCRTASYPFRVEQAVTVQDFIDQMQVQ